MFTAARNASGVLLRYTEFGDYCVAHRVREVNPERVVWGLPGVGCNAKARPQII